MQIFSWSRFQNDNGGNCHFERSEESAVESDEKQTPRPAASE
jgi:hypothetical protein